MRSEEWDQIQCGRCSNERRLESRHIEREGHVRTWWEVWSASHREKSHRKPGQSNTLILGFQSSEWWESTCLLCKLPVLWCFLWLPQTIHAASFNEIPPWPFLVLDSQNTLENSSCWIHWRNPDKCWWLAKVRKKKSPRNWRRLVLYTDDQRGFFPCAKVFIVWCSWQWQGLAPSSDS